MNPTVVCAHSEQPFDSEDRQRLIDEGEATAQVVFTQMRQEQIRFPVPGLEQTVNLREARIAGLRVQLLQDK